MGRRRRVVRRAVEPDPKYNSELVGRLVNHLMKVGKKSVSVNIVYAKTRKGVPLRRALAQESLDA